MFLFRNTFANGAIWISIFYYALAYFFAPAEQGVTITGFIIFGIILAVTEVYDLLWGRSANNG